MWQETRNKEQMYHIREGLENGVDVSFYINPLFSEEQMEIIRKGLESGLDAKFFAKLEYSEYGMIKIIEDLK